MTTTDQLSVALRAYAECPPAHVGESRFTLGPSDGVLVFDTETTVDAAQQLRVGCYQLHWKGRLAEHGLFYDPLSVTDAEIALATDYAAKHSLKLMTAAQFVEQVFFGKAYATRSLIVGFNLPFDLSRLAIGHDSARGKAMHGGFSLKLSPDRHWPHVQVRHLNKHVSLLRFTTPKSQPRTRSEQRRDETKPPPRRGFFCDVRSLASALYGGSHSLASLAKLLGTAQQKLDAEEHGGPLTDAYLDYLCADVAATWQCFAKLAARYASFALTQTGVHRIYSEASIGKATLREMAVRPWRVAQPAFPDKLTGIIMSTYYGGRSEVHIRRQVVRVLYCDFLSMYPTVSTLMGLWRFVTAKGTRFENATAEVRALVAGLQIGDLQRPEFWRDLAVLVKVKPHGDLLPVRARYHGRQHSIGLNELTSDDAQWFTLADVLATRLRTGRTPHILKALRFVPGQDQTELAPIDLMGKSDYHLDPYRHDLYRRLIELRGAANRVRDDARRAGDTERAEQLDAEQQALKVCANAVCYGIHFEINVDEARKARDVCYWGFDGKRRVNRMSAIEEPGQFFHPLLATLTTAAARLLLAITEHLAEAEGIGWAFCDTDSVALARPQGMADSEFLARAERVRTWFEPLNPYDDAGELFKVEEQNYGLRRGKPTRQLAPLHCFAVSAKRYALFNLDRHRRPVLRKVSGHGLGYLLPPYADEAAPAIIPAPCVPLADLGVGIRRWQHDLWYLIVLGALDGHPGQPRVFDLPGFELPAMSRYAATTPELLSWFAAYNRETPYREQVRPFGFLTALQVKNVAERVLAEWAGEAPTATAFGLPETPRVVAPFDRDPAVAASRCFERATGRPVPVAMLRTYAECLGQYHLHPEAKFANGEYADVGLTERRHVHANGVEHIGKEANRWEERFFVGDDPEGQISYGQPDEHRERQHREIVETIRRLGVRRVARESGLSVGLVSGIMRGERLLSERSMRRLTAVLEQNGLDAGATGTSTWVVSLTNASDA
jgi:hypothetical protein